MFFCKKKLRLFICILTLIPVSLFAKMGTESGGGGQGLISEDGRVQLVDLLTVEELSQKLMSPNKRDDIFWRKDRYVKRIGQFIPDFFNCATDRFQQHETQLPILKSLRTHLKSVKALGVEFKFISIDENQIDYNFKLPYVANYSNRIRQEDQNPIAVFTNGRLWVSNRLYKNMPKEHQCGLAIHEALRLLNFSSELEESLTTDEIEVATRYFMDASLENDNVLGTINKIQNKKISKEEYLELSNEKEAEANALRDYRFNYWDSLSSEDRLRLESKQWELFNESSKLNALSVISKAKLPEINKFTNGIGIERDYLINEGLTQNLAAYKYYDIIENKIVFRILKK